MEGGGSAMIPSFQKAASLLGLGRRRPEPNEGGRRHERFAANESARVSWADAQGIGRDMQVTVVNVSESGMAFLSSQRFDAGGWIEIEAGERTYHAIVRHARDVEDSFAIGVELFPTGRPLEQSLRRLAFAVANRRR